MLGALAGQFDSLGILVPCLLEGKLILQKGLFQVLVGTMNFQWSKGVNVMGSFAGLSIPRYCFLEGLMIEDNENVAYRLHGFCDTSNQALSCVMYLRRIINGRSFVTFV